MRKLCLSFISGAIAVAMPSDAGRIERSGNQMTLIVDGPRPVELAVLKLAEQFGIPISVEDPCYMFKDDVKDVTSDVALGSAGAKRVLVPKGGRLLVQFSVGADGSPADIRLLLRKLVSNANAQFPFKYRLDGEEGSFALVPTTTRDVTGRVIENIPLLDRRITIPPGTRPIMESANLMAEALSAQAGHRVSCCQSLVAGTSWGLQEVAFEANNEPARSVLKRLIVASLDGQPNRYFWLQRCDPLPSRWCSINLGSASADAAP